jgi:hypothetical protein
MNIVFGISKSVRVAASSVTNGVLRTLGKSGRAKKIGDRSEKFLTALDEADAIRKEELEANLQIGSTRKVERS